MPNDPSRIKITDDVGRDFIFDSPPSRIVSLVPSLTETFVLLGAGERLVGITDYCIHPEEALAHLPRIGGTKNPDIGQILSLAPDLVIANKEENRKQDVEVLAEQTAVFITYPRTVWETIKTVLVLGTLSNTLDQASQFASACETLLRSIKKDAALFLQLRTVCMLWRNPWMTAGPDTYVSDILETVGFHNVLERSVDRYPKTTIEAVVEMDPDVIFLPDEPYEFGENDKVYVEDILEKQGSGARVECIVGEYLTWFGSRTLEALKYLKDLKKKLI